MTNMYMPTQYIKTIEAFKTYINKLDASKKYDINKTKERITNSDGDSRVRCRIMAKLSSSDISVTPYINSILLFLRAGRNIL